MKTIFAISGSLRSGSSNHQILRYLQALSPGNISFRIYENLSKIPPFDPGLDNEAPPDTVIALRNFIKASDAVIICTPEYAYGVPGQFKNALDWMVSSGSFDGKPTALITASTGGENAHAALLKILGAINADLIEEATLLISFIRSKIDAHGNITDTATAANLTKAFESIKTVINITEKTGSL